MRTNVWLYFIAGSLAGMAALALAILSALSVRSQVAAPRPGPLAVCPLAAFDSAAGRCLAAGGAIDPTRPEDARLVWPAGDGVSVDRQDGAGNWITAAAQGAADARQAGAATAGGRLVEPLAYLTGPIWQLGGCGGGPYRIGLRDGAGRLIGAIPLDIGC